MAQSAATAIWVVCLAGFVANEKPPILQESHFVVQEGWTYRFLRGASIQLNRLMFASLILLVVWLFWAGASGTEGCVQVPNIAAENNTQENSAQIAECSVWLTETTKFLGIVSILSFVLSIVLGLLGLVVGKNIVESTPAGAEFGARGAANEDDEAAKDGNSEESE